ncbi:MAG: response regulator transcription factor [Chitinophagaceae bacterium]
MEATKSYIKVALVDDHVLLRSALAALIEGFGECRVIHQCDNGQELVSAISSSGVPDLVILDLNMPKMDGHETALWLRKNYPGIHILMLTMYDSELSLIRLLQTGVKGFLKKDIHPSELKFAIESVMQTGFYYSSHTAGKLFNLFRSNEEGSINLPKAMLSEQEVIFLKLTCTDLTYKEIAQKMGYNPRSIDTLRDQLFIRLDVRSRVGLAMVAIKHGIVTF